MLLIFYSASIGPAVLIFREPPRAVEKFYAPLGWLAEHTPLDGPLSAYVEYWLRLRKSDRSSE